MPFVRLLRLLLIVAPIGLTACSGGLGVGDGNKLNAINIVNGSGLTAIVPPMVVYQCLRQSLGLIGTFTNGETGNYTTRAVWTSSNDQIVHVSNAILPDDAVPSTLGPNGQPDSTTVVYAKGTLVPGQQPGTAIVTATYVGLTSSVNVVVKTPYSIFISKDTPTYIGGVPVTGAQGQGNTPMFTPTTALTIAQYSLQPLHVLSDLNGTGVLTDVTSYALWSLSDPSGAIATVSSSGVLTGVAPNPASALQVQIGFDSCTSPPENTDTTFYSALTVAPIDHLEMRSEQQNDSLDTNPTTTPTTSLFTTLPGQLITATNEAMQVLAHFDSTNIDTDPVNHPTQDLSTQATYYTDYNYDCPNLNVVTNGVAIPNPDPVTELGFSAIPTFANIVTAGAPNAISPPPLVKLSASFVTQKFNGGTSQSVCATNDVLRSVILGRLNSVAIRSDDQNLTIQPQGSQQFHAMGSFVDTNGATVGTQDITRSAIWTVSDSTQASIGNTSSATVPGFAVSSQFTGSCINVIATDSAAVNIPFDYTRLLISGPGNPAGNCPPIVQH